MAKITVVVTIGTNALTHEDASLNIPLITKLGSKLAEIRREDDLVLVSSGAMGAGRYLLKKEMKDIP